MISKEIKQKILEIKQKALGAEKILIVSHEKPDGDAIGSSLALRMGLRALNKAVEVAIMDPPPSVFTYLPCIWKLRDGFAPQDFDMVFITDCGGWSRTGFFEDDELNIDWPNHLVVIDHHPVQGLTPGTHIIMNQVAAAAQIIYYILKLWQIEITKDIATCLLTGLSTDTGSFKHSNTTAEVFSIASDLISRGADLNKINYNIYADKSIAKLRLWGRTLDKIKEDRSRGILSSYVNTQDLQECGASIADLEGVIDLMRTVPGMQAVMLLSDRGDYVKASLRSESNVDVSKLASILGGGGHVKAAGFNIPKKLMP